MFMRREFRFIVIVENWQEFIFQEVSYVPMRLKDQHLASLRYLYYLEIAEAGF